MVKREKKLTETKISQVPLGSLMTNTTWRLKMHYERFYKETNATFLRYMYLM